MGWLVGAVGIENDPKLLSPAISRRCNRLPNPIADSADSQRAADRDSNTTSPRWPERRTDRIPGGRARSEYWYDGNPVRPPSKCEFSDHPQSGLSVRGGVCDGKRGRLMCDRVANAPELRECHRNFRPELRIRSDASLLFAEPAWA